MGNFGDIPVEIMLDIFTRLPTESVLDCKSVSKTWKNVIHHTSFCPFPLKKNTSFYQTHSELLLRNPDSSADSGKFSFIFQMRYLPEQYSKRLLYYLEYDAEVSSHRVRNLKLNPPFELWSIIGSCNGLVCIIGLPNHYTVDNSTSASYVAYICNPITRECITLPELNRETYYYRVRFMLSGFGYVASTNEYKVVRLYTFWEERYFAQVEVYTLGSGKGWRNAGKINVNPGSISRQDAVFVNGFLFWDFGKGKTRAFDLAGEVFVELDGYWKNGLWIGVFGGCLCSLDYSRDGKRSNVWVLKKKEDESFRWSQEFSLINTNTYTVPLALTTSGRVLWYSYQKLYLYDLRSSCSKMLEDFGGMIYHVTPHMNTLVSPKPFEEVNAENT